MLVFNQLKILFWRVEKIITELLLTPIMCENYRNEHGADI